VASEAGSLDALVGAELFEPVPDAAVRISDEIRRRHQGAVAAVIFYGSCLRKRTAEGVFDFYAIVDSHRAAYASRYLRVVGSALPPNVFFLETPGPAGPLRAKYAVMTVDEFSAATRPEAPRSGIWARFCQPARLVHARDDDARAAVVAAARDAVTTALEVGIPLLPGSGDHVEFESAEFWNHTLAATYAAEMRTESPETIRSVYAADPERFDRALRAGLETLAGAGRIRFETRADCVRVDFPEGRRQLARRDWEQRRRGRKFVYFASLLKSATTFGDWLPYVLWKLQRHTGTTVELSERQRRHPLIFGWPALLRVLRNRDLR
jgi:hypothetical protein